jgi:signal peptidase II
VSARGPGFGRAAAVALLAVGADQLSKAIVRASVLPGEVVDLVGGVQIVRVANRGIAFGLLDGAGAWVLVIAAIAFAALLMYFLAGDERPGLWLPIGLLAGGAIGNLIDRAREGFVTDFIDPPGWPAFNVADVAITTGVLLLLWIYVVGPGSRQPAPEPTRPTADP